VLELQLGCRMPVEMIIDQWNPSRRHYRTETFCYGPVLARSTKPDRRAGFPAAAVQSPTRRRTGLTMRRLHTADWE
jgi:hypothetical protein